MDQTAVEQNENLLGQFLDQSDKKFIGQVGVMALTLLSEQMEPQQYKQFLSECVDNAVEMHRFKMLNGKPDKTSSPADDSPQQ